MKITSIKQQVKQVGRYSIFVDGSYSFSLSESALLESKLTSGQTLSTEDVEQYKQASDDDKLHTKALRYATMRRRSQWEIEQYLRRQKAPTPLVENILNKLSEYKYINDELYAEVYVADKQLLSPASRRKIIFELRKKQISQEYIDKALEVNDIDEQASLKHVIANKRRQPKYQDNQKLMQYLARQGFNYEDIKAALA